MLTDQNTMRLKERCHISRIFFVDFWRVLRITKQLSEIAGVSQNVLPPFEWR